jgi:hypothetical protein
VRNGKRRRFLDLKIRRVADGQLCFAHNTS